MKNLKTFLISLAIPLSVGLLSSLLTGGGMGDYEVLNNPPLSPPGWVFPIVWTILYILIAISIYLVLKDNKLKDIPSYTKSLIINYFSNQIFSFLFFTIKSPFLALIDTFIVLISSLFLYYESKELNKTSAKLLVPYIAWNITRAHWAV